MGERLAIDPNRNAILYLGVRGGHGLWRGTGAGATWTRAWQITSWPERVNRDEIDYSEAPWLTWNSTPAPPEQAPKLGWMTECVEIDPFDSDHLLCGAGATYPDGMGSNVSPRVLSVSWGHLSVEGLGDGKDFKLFPGGGRAWDWNETGTRHDPGIQPDDVVELLDHGATTVVLSQGMDLKLRVSAETVRLLDERGIVLHIAETRTAVALYNELAGATAVGGLFHSTC